MHLCMTYSLGIYNFIEEISILLLLSILFCSILLFPFCCFLLFLCIVHLRRLSYLSLLFSEALHSDGYVFPFLLCFLLLFSSQLFVRPPQTTILPFFFLVMVLITASCTMSWTSVHSSSGTVSIRSNPWNLSLPLYNHKGLDLGHTCMV